MNESGGLALLLGYLRVILILMGAPSWSAVATKRRVAVLIIMRATLRAACSDAADSTRPVVVIVAPTWPPRHALVQAGGESWRAGAPAVFVTEGDVEAPIAVPYANTTEERWFTYPDDLRQNLSIWKKGDMKAAGSLRVANESLGGAYDWIAYGDDDTVFILDNVYRLVQGLDPSVPIILSDSVSFCADGRCKEAKICSLPGSPQPDSGTCTARPAAAPCTRDVLRSPGTCNMPDPWYGLPFACGRNGALISRGMMSVMTGPEWHEECEIPNARGGGGDLRVYHCLFERGWVMTDPTVGDNSFCAFGFLNPSSLLQVADDASVLGMCDANCSRVLFETISVTLDLVGATPEYAKLLHTKVKIAKAAVRSRLRAQAQLRLQDDGERLRELAATINSAVVATSISNEADWPLVVNFVRHAINIINVTVIVFVQSEKLLANCAALSQLCFLPGGVISQIEQLRASFEHRRDWAWRLSSAHRSLFRPAVLSLASRLDVNLLYASSDVILQPEAVDVLFAERAQAVSYLCVRQSATSESRGTFELVAFRNLKQTWKVLTESAVRALSEDEFASRSVGDHDVFVARQLRAVHGDGAVSCVGELEGFSSTCCRNVKEAARNAVHVGVGTVEDKIAFMKREGLWQVD